MQDPALLPVDIRAYLEAENAYTKAEMAETETLQEQLFAELKGRIKEDDSSVPAIDGTWAYYRRFREGGEYPIFARRPAGNAFEKDGAEEVLLDGNEHAKGCDYWDVRKVPVKLRGTGCFCPCNRTALRTP